jgi:ribosomal protein L37AE/L43A
MGQRQAFVDERLIAREFATGDVVRKTGLRDLLLSPYVGRVLYSNPETGKVAIQWPWGEEQDNPSELVRDVSGDYIPPLLANQEYSTWESARHTHTELSNIEDKFFRQSIAAQKVARRFLQKSMVARVVERYEEKTKPIWRAACKAWYNGLDEFVAFQKLAATHSEEFGEDTVRLTVANLYELGRRVALYWKDNKRKYRVTQKEKSSGQMFCPRCKNPLKPRVFRQGQRMLNCRACGFSIHPKDLV